MQRTIGVVLGALVAATVLVACGGGNGSSGNTTGPTGGSTGGAGLTIGGITANDHGSKDITGASSVELEADDFYFAPTVLQGSAGQTVTIELKNEGSAEHNLTIESLDIDQDVEPGESAEVEVTLPQTGTLEFFCKYHQRSGMVGEFTVS
jgi:plastocyanin